MKLLKARGPVPRAVLLLVLALSATAWGQSKSDPARGAKLAAVCTACHGPGSDAPLPGMPALAGQQSEFLELQLILIREGLRDIPAMKGMLDKLQDRDLIDLAAHYSRLPPQSFKVRRDEKRYAQGAAAAQGMGCGSCHMGDFSGQRQVPRITGQREDYLITALKAYRDNQRSGTDTSMNAVMYKASEADIAALAHFLSQQ